MLFTNEYLTNLFHEACDHAVTKGFPDIRHYGWTFKTNRRYQAFGLCSYRTKTIQISKVLQLSNQQVWNTMLHEIAHALTKGSGHGHQWRSTFHALGGTGERCSSANDIHEEVMLAKVHKEAYKWAIVDSRNGQVVKRYIRKPRRDVSALGFRNDPDSFGNLELKRL